jgi:hypothetical protein
VCCLTVCQGARQAINAQPPTESSVNSTCQTYSTGSESCCVVVQASHLMPSMGPHSEALLPPCCSLC